MKTSEQNSLLSKLACRAKKRLCGLVEKEECNQRVVMCEYVSSTRTMEREKLEKKIFALLKNNSDCIDPIGRLIDHEVYDRLSDERKQAYVLKLSKEYREIADSFL